MAERLDVTQATYSRTENRITEPNDEMLERIAGILQVPKQRLFQAESSENPPAKAENEDSDEKTPQFEPVINARDIPPLIRDLKQLLDEGIITEAQFKAKRDDLLARL